MLLGVLLAAGTGQAHDFGDDYGDAPTNATALTVNAARSGRIEIDVDSDWFSFQASPLKMYTVVATTGTIWDTTCTVLAPDKATVVGSTDSILAADSRVSWIHFGPPRSYYVGVGGFARFTTGTYWIVVQEAAYVDADHDGMEDAWEMSRFGSMSQTGSQDYDGDGSSNLEEFRAGSAPTNPKSYVRITGISSSSNRNGIAWQAYPSRYYRLSSSTNLIAGPWEQMNWATNLGASTVTMWLYDTNAPSPRTRFYRIQCILQ